MMKLATAGSLLVLLFATACATRPADRAEAAERGRVLAEKACSQCHGMDEEPSPRRDALAFRDMSFHLNSYMYERRVAELTHRHVGMPPMELSDQDLADIAAYVHRLKRTERRATDR